MKSAAMIATINRNLAEILERYPVDLAAMTDEITKAVKSLEGIMEKKRPAERPPPVPVEPKGSSFNIRRQKRSMRARKWNVTRRWHNGGLRKQRHQQRAVV